MKKFTVDFKAMTGSGQCSGCHSRRILYSVEDFGDNPDAVFGDYTPSLCADCWKSLIGAVTSELTGAVTEPANERGACGTIKHILEQYLNDNGYDGLYFPGECGCLKDDLMPCGGDPSACEPGYLTDCDCGEHDYHIGPNKPANKRGGKDEQSQG